MDARPLGPQRIRRDPAARRYPFLVGLGFGLAWAVLPWIPQPKFAYLPILGLVFAVPISALHIRSGRPAWMGFWHTAAACLSVLIAAALMLVPLVVTVGHPNLFGLPDVLAFPPGLVILVLEGLFATWIACQLQRWAEAAEGMVFVRGSNWDPRHWGALGVVGGTLSLLNAPYLLAIAVLYSDLPGLGPSRMGYFFSGLITGIAVLVGLIFVLADAKGTR